MDNRLSDDGLDDAKAVAVRNAAAIRQAAEIIFRLLPLGTSLRVEWIEAPAILTPGAKPKKSVLNINKPAMDLMMGFKQ